MGLPYRRVDLGARADSPGVGFLSGPCSIAGYLLAVGFATFGGESLPCGGARNAQRGPDDLPCDTEYRMSATRVRLASDLIDLQLARGEAPKKRFDGDLPSADNRIIDLEEVRRARRSRNVSRPKRSSRWACCCYFG